MGGQACVFYGAAQVSKDVDVVLLAEAGNFARLEQALHALAARRIAVPPFDLALLARGHAVHFRCAAPGVEELRVDIMTRLRDRTGEGVLQPVNEVRSDRASRYFRRRMSKYTAPKITPPLTMYWSE